MPIIEWKEPPAANTRGRQGSPDHAEIATELESSPGRWAFLGAANPTLASNIRNGTLLAYRPKGTFEAVARDNRKDDNGKTVADIYARYVGNGQGES